MHSQANRPCLSLVKYPIPYEGVIQTYVTRCDGYTITWCAIKQSQSSVGSGIKAGGKRASVVYVIYLGKADYWSNPPSLLSLRKKNPVRQQQECWTLWPIKPELAENERREEEGEEKKWGGEEHVSREPSGTWPWLQEWQLLQLTVGARLHWELSTKNNWIFFKTVTRPSLLFIFLLLFISVSLSSCTSWDSFSWFCNHIWVPQSHIYILSSAHM